MIFTHIYVVLQYQYVSVALDPIFIHILERDYEIGSCPGKYCMEGQDHFICVTYQQNFREGSNYFQV